MIIYYLNEYIVRETDVHEGVMKCRCEATQKDHREGFARGDRGTVHYVVVITAVIVK